MSRLSDVEEQRIRHLLDCSGTAAVLAELHGFQTTDGDRYAVIAKEERVMEKALERATGGAS